MQTTIERQNSAPSLEASDRIFTAANVITFIRLCMIPVSFGLLLDGKDIAAGICFGLTAATDFLDGMVARKTNTVTKLGQFLDPLVDRLLIIAAVVGLLIVGRMPVWIVVLIIIRDAYLIAGAAYLVKGHQIRIPVSYIGKVAMWFLCIGFGGLLLNVPILMGLGIVDYAFLPGLNSNPYCFFVWFLYIGMLLSLTVTVVYTVRGSKALAESKRRAKGAGNDR